jgi:hypothetical protein
MFGTHTSRSIGVRLAALVVAGLSLLALTGAAARAAGVGGTDYAFNFGDPGDNGTLTVFVACDRYTHKGWVGLSFQTPLSTPGGLWVNTRVLVKNRAATSWANALVLDQRQQFVQTVSQQFVPTYSGGYYLSTNSPKTILAAAGFTGAAGGSYDVAVQFWVARPGGPWAGFSFTATETREVIDRWGTTITTTTCQT